MYSRAPYVAHVPHDTYTTDRAASIVRASRAQLGAAAAGTTYTRPERLGPDKPGTTGEETSTWIYVGIGLGVLAVGGLAYYLATQKKGRRR